MHVAVEGDSADVEDGSGGAHDVHREVNFAEEVGEHPRALQSPSSGHSHHKQCYEKIRDSERDVERVRAFS